MSSLWSISEFPCKSSSIYVDSVNLFNTPLFSPTGSLLHDMMQDHKGAVKTQQSSLLVCKVLNQLCFHHDCQLNGVLMVATITLFGLQNARPLGTGHPLPAGVDHCAMFHNAFVCMKHHQIDALMLAGVLPLLNTLCTHCKFTMQLASVCVTVSSCQTIPASSHDHPLLLPPLCQHALALIALFFLLEVRTLAVRMLVEED
jgi:hypothetical protein